MPTMTLYVRDEAEPLWTRARELAGERGLSQFVEEALRKMVATREAEALGFERVEFVNAVDDRRTVFTGRRLGGGPEEGPGQADGVTDTVYVTPKGRLVLLRQVRRGGHRWTGYQSFASLEDLRDWRGERGWWDALHFLSGIEWIAVPVRREVVEASASSLGRDATVELDL